MNRDPENRDCTADPIYLLQDGRRQWTEIPDGLEFEDGVLCVVDLEDVPDWIRPYIDEEGLLNETPEFWRDAESAESSTGFPLVYTEWRTQRVFLTRPEATDFAEATAYRYEKWRVYCVPCEGDLADLLREYEPVESN